MFLLGKCHGVRGAWQAKSMGSQRVGHELATNNNGAWLFLGIKYDECFLLVRLAGEITTTSDMQMIPLEWQKAKRNERVSWWERRVEKPGLKLNIQNTKIMASGPITSWQINGEKWKEWQTLFSWAPNHSGWWLQPQNYKTLALWKKSYDKLRQRIKKQRGAW